MTSLEMYGVDKFVSMMWGRSSPS